MIIVVVDTCVCYWWVEVWWETGYRQNIGLSLHRILIKCKGRGVADTAWLGDPGNSATGGTGMHREPPALTCEKSTASFWWHSHQGRVSHRMKGQSSLQTGEDWRLFQMAGARRDWQLNAMRVLQRSLCGEGKGDRVETVVKCEQDGLDRCAVSVWISWRGESCGRGVGACPCF